MFERCFVMNSFSRRSARAWTSRSSRRGTAGRPASRKRVSPRLVSLEAQWGLLESEWLCECQFPKSSARNLHTRLHDPLHVRMGTALRGRLCSHKLKPDETRVQRGTITAAIPSTAMRHRRTTILRSGRIVALAASNAANRPTMTTVPQIAGLKRASGAQLAGAG